MRKAFLVVSIVLLIGATMGVWGAAKAQSSEETFDETGHRVRGEFLAFFYRVPNPILLYGYPITDAFTDVSTGMTVQYFQKARFELHLAEPAARRVQLTPLGSRMYSPGQPELAVGGSSGCRSFPDRSFQVCASFLEFFDTNGGVEQFGYPISNFESSNGKMVQYFERARFEWRPGLNGKSEVALTDLGTQYFYASGESIDLLEVDSQDFILQGGVLRLRARAYPEKAVTGGSGKQTIYVLVQDQRLLPIENVEVTIVMRLPNGQVRRYIAASKTDKNGITSVGFEFSSGTVGMAQVEVFAVRDRIEVQTQTTFRVWY